MNVLIIVVCLVFLAPLIYVVLVLALVLAYYLVIIFGLPLLVTSVTGSYLLGFLTVIPMLILATLIYSKDH